MGSGEVVGRRASVWAPWFTRAPAWARSAAAVAALVLLQVLLFSPSWGAFFCGDSVFYLSRVVEPAQLRYLFTHHDIQGAYRPLGYLLHSWLLYPLFGLNPLGYHLAMLALHLAVSLLAYRLFRVLLPPEAALVGLFFFGTHAVNFYPTFDASFLPDVTMMLAWLGALVSYERFTRLLKKPLPAQAGHATNAACTSPSKSAGKMPALRRAAWYASAVLWFLAGLLSKETMATLPATLWTWDVILRRQHAAGAWRFRDWLKLRPAVIPFFVLDGLYLAWAAHLKRGLLYPGGVYSFTLRAADLARKRDYLFWLANLPADLARGRELALAAAAVMLPAVLWALWHLAAAWPRRKVELVACALWAAASIAPVLVVTQAPMPHHLYMPVLALSLALGMALETAAARGAATLLRRHGWVAAAVVLAAALQIQWDLRYSWVGEGARITEASLEAVRRAYPTLPHGALLYVLPTQVRGNVAWYFDSGGLFRVFYGDPSLRMAFADGGQSLPADFAARKDVFIFRFTDGRLYDVTADYKAEHSDSLSYCLLPHFSPASVVSRIRWKPSDLPPQGPVYAGAVSRGDVSREALIMLPGSSVRIPVPAIAPGSVLEIGATPEGPRNSGTRGEIHFESEPEGRGELVASVTLDSFDQKEDWWDSQVDLARWVGHSGTLVLSTIEDRGADWLAWSRLRIGLPGARHIAFRSAGIREHGLLQNRLLDAFDPERVEMDGQKPTPGLRFETPTGAPVFFHLVRSGDGDNIARLALVTLAGASVSFPVTALLPDSALLLSLAPASHVGDGTDARVYFEQAGRRDLLMVRQVKPQQPGWQDVAVPLGGFAGREGVLILECGPGPARDTAGDWLAWGRLRIE